MQRLAFDELFAMLRATDVSPADPVRLRAWVASLAHPAECLALIEQAANGRPCPHCRCARLQRCGQASGLQRFRCLGCRRTYNALAGTPLARLRKRERWLPYLQCMLESKTVRNAALATGVHRTTSFRWRHRVVAGSARQRPAELSAIVEADETYRLESQKGSRTLARPPWKRGGAASRRGISRDHDCLLVAHGQTLLGKCSRQKRISANTAFLIANHETRDAWTVPQPGITAYWRTASSCLVKVVEYRDIKLGNPPDSAFTIPADYKVRDVTAH